MNENVKAIPTEYNGIKFRSRLEARWAVFFDAMEIRWEYEKEGYQLSSGWYLPDFWLTDMKIWVEVKPEGGFCEHAASLRNTLGFPVCVTDGTPDRAMTVYCFCESGSSAGSSEWTSTRWGWCDGPVVVVDCKYNQKNLCDGSYAECESLQVEGRYSSLQIHSKYEESVREAKKYQFRY